MSRNVPVYKGILTLERLKELLAYEPDTGLFRWRADNKRAKQVIAGSIAGSIHPRYGWIGIGIDRRIYKAHHLAWFYVHGVWPHKQIDHKDGIASNNAIGNLRLATDAQNKVNQRVRRDSLSGVKGVRLYPPLGKWNARIGVGGKRKHLGYFDTLDEAKKAYEEAAKQLHGEFRRRSNG